MDIKERIQKYIDFKGINIYSFEKSIGCSNGYWRKTKSISANILSVITEIYSDLSIDWVITGQGDMFKSDQSSTTINKFKNIKDRINYIIEYHGLTEPDFYKSIGIPSGCNSKTKDYVSESTLNHIMKKYPHLNREWLFTGEGSVFRFVPGKESKSNSLDLKNNNYLTFDIPIESKPLKTETRPRIPYTAAAGSLTSAVEGVTAEQCEQIPRITAFPNYDFTIIIKGNSMEPKYEGGDEVACKRIDNTSFIQWGKVHVMDTAQGIIIKRIYEDDDKVRCVSYNPEYPDFSISKEEIYSMSLIVGLLRM